MQRTIIDRLHSPQVVKVSGVKFPTLNSWVAKGLVSCEMAGMGRSGVRLWTFKDIIRVRVVKQLRDDGASLQAVRTSVKVLTEKWAVSDPLASGQLLVIDGNVVYAETPNQLWDVISGQKLIKNLLVVDIQSLAIDTDRQMQEMLAA